MTAQHFRVIRRILMITGVSVLFIVVISAVHIYMVVPADDGYVNTTIQLARIDFKQALSAADFEQIEQIVRSQKGVTQTYFNKQDCILVYAFKNTEQNSANVYDALIKTTRYSAERFIPSDEALQKGCPVGGEQSAGLFRRTGKFLHKIFG